jgi:uncharacterized protein (TIGR04551 family)
MPKVSVVALLAAGPIVCAASFPAFAQTKVEAPAADARGADTAPSSKEGSKDTGNARANKKGAATKNATNKSNGAAAATDKSQSTAKTAGHNGDVTPEPAKPNGDEPTATPPASGEPAGEPSTSVAGDATAPNGEGTQANGNVEPAQQPGRAALPNLPRGASEPAPNTAAGPLLPAGLAPTAESAPAAAVSPTEKTEKADDAVLAEDWWSHARPILELHGYFRTRAEMFHNFSLGRLSAPEQALWTMPADNRYSTGNSGSTGGPYGPSLCTPGESDEVPGDSNAAVKSNTIYACKNKNQSGANLRFRVNPELHVSDNLRIISQIDVLDNLVFGSTPSGYANVPSGSSTTNAAGYSVATRNGYVPMSFFDNTTEPPSAGINSYKDSIRVKRVWGEYSTPVGQLRFGRMPDHFGMGMYHHAGDGYDDDYQSTIDRIMFISNIKPLELYIGGAWDFPNSGATSENLQNPQAQAYNVSNLVNVRQFSLILMRQKSPQLQRLALARGDLVLNGGAYLQYRWQDLAADRAGACDTDYAGSGGASLGCASWGVTNAMVRRGARAFTPDLWLQVLYKKFRFEAEAVTVQGSIDNVSSSDYVYGQNPGGGAWLLRSYGIATEIQQRLLEDRLDISFNWGWASGDANAAQTDGAMGLRPGNDGLQRAQGSNTFSTFRFNPAYRVDLILNRNILSRIQGTYYFRPSIGYDFMRKTNGQRLGGNLAGIWTRASEFTQAPGHQRDLGIEVDASIYFQSKDGALNDKPGNMGGFFTMLQYGMLFPMGGLGYAATPGSNIQSSFGNTDLSTAQILRWYMGIFY